MHVIIITLVAAACLGLVKAKTVDAEIHDLINLGQVEGKNYYYDSTTVRDWSESGNYCIESGMNSQQLTLHTRRNF
ncbi:hypothetical protein Ocin01_14489 [Orchesella cincta]|uniref:Uncharacterized protein n=1 Tax=Orchesella cincta TaxID=48709 RepID=A0A1D2MGS8_ORCCI|nr:hypothetical protein Ocin01_14489 [Orchesella cincta]